MRCPKCFRKMRNRGYAFYCFHCDSYVILDIAVFLNHFIGEVFHGKNHSTAATVDQTDAAQLED